MDCSLSQLLLVLWTLQASYEQLLLSPVIFSHLGIKPASPAFPALQVNSFCYSSHWGNSEFLRGLRSQRTQRYLLCKFLGWGTRPLLSSAPLLSDYLFFLHPLLLISNLPCFGTSFFREAGIVINKQAAGNTEDCLGRASGPKLWFHLLWLGTCKLSRPHWISALKWEKQAWSVIGLDKKKQERKSYYIQKKDDSKNAIIPKTPYLLSP